MIALLDTSTPTCHLSFVDGDWRHDATWEAGRQLAKGLLAFVEAQLRAQDKAWGDLSGLVVYRGPGSFTGLRIGITVWNSLAYARALPIVGAMGDDWQDVGLERLGAGQSDAVVLPEYGGEANITTPRK